MDEAKIVKWADDEEAAIQKAVDVLGAGGGAVVSPTKVGYIIITTDEEGLKRKFDLKQRPLRKPGVVLCSSMDELRELAQLNDEIEQLYQAHYDKDILLGCILPWKPEAMKKYIPEGCDPMVHDARDTSCFVIRFGSPSERIAEKFWAEGKLVFASSANPSGQGNRGRLEGVGERIASGADLLIDADEFVKNQQPDKDEGTRYEQGVMVSMVDDDANFLEKPIVIRKGLDVEKIMFELSEIYDAFDYRQGQYY